MSEELNKKLATQNMVLHSAIAEKAHLARLKLQEIKANRYALYTKMISLQKPLKKVIDDAVVAWSNSQIKSLELFQGFTIRRADITNEFLQKLTNSVYINFLHEVNNDSCNIRVEPPISIFENLPEYKEYQDISEQHAVLNKEYFILEGNIAGIKDLATAMKVQYNIKLLEENPETKALLDEARSSLPEITEKEYLFKKPTAELI